MLLRFRFSNFRSFRDESELSLLATRLDVDTRRSVRTSAVTDETVDALPVIAILGGNASGKSSLVQAMKFMRRFVSRSAFGLDPIGATGRECFLLDDAGSDKPSLFEIDFVIRGERFVYGFEIDDRAVVGEWLHTFPHRRTQVLFDRDGDEFTFGRNLTGQNRRIVDLTRPNALFLSTAVASNHRMLTPIFEWISNNLIPTDLDRLVGAEALARRIEGREERIGAMLALADLGITGARVDRVPVSDEEREHLRQSLERRLRPDHADRERLIEDYLRRGGGDALQLRLAHRSRSGSLDLDFAVESLGTKRWLAMVVASLDAIDRGSTVVVDELASSLHPALVAELLRLFADPALNKSGAQLIFTTHDTWTLDPEAGPGLSRGQIWFVEKSADGASSLLPLSDYRPRKGENIRRGYLQGRYGGLPRPHTEQLRASALETLAGTAS